MYKCIDGTRVSEATIKRKYSESLKNKHAGHTAFVCEGCGKQAVHNDHTIAKARCKVIHKTELIWDPLNYESSCANCHQEWESYENGEYLKNNNVSHRMDYLKLYDPEGYRVRIQNTKLKN